MRPRAKERGSSSRRPAQKVGCLAHVFRAGAALISSFVLLAAWLADWLAGWLTGWLAGWLIGNQICHPAVCPLATAQSLPFSFFPCSLPTPPPPPLLVASLSFTASLSAQGKTYLFRTTKQTFWPLSTRPSRLLPLVCLDQAFCCCACGRS